MGLEGMAMRKCRDERVAFGCIHVHLHGVGVWASLFLHLVQPDLIEFISFLLVIIHLHIHSIHIR